VLTPKIKGKFSPCIDDRKLHLTCFEQPAHSVTPLPLALLSLKGRISQHLDRLFSYCNSVFCALFLKRTPLQPLLGPLNTLTPLLILHFKPVFSLPVPCVKASYLMQALPCQASTGLNVDLLPNPEHRRLAFRK